MRDMTFRPNGHWLGADEGATVTVADFPSGPHVFGIASGCGMCGARPEFSVAGDEVTASTSCPCPDGVTSVITLAVPSGRIVVGDDLRPVYNWDDSEMASYNSALGQKQAVEAMAAAGCAYGPVGNSCPGLYLVGNGYVIASPGLDENDNPLLPEKDCLAGIVTDLWAYSIADFEDWKARGGDPASLGWSYTIVDVPPGVYEFTHHTGEAGFDHDAEGIVVFAHIRRVS